MDGCLIDYTMIVLDSIHLLVQKTFTNNDYKEAIQYGIARRS